MKEYKFLKFKLFSKEFVIGVKKKSKKGSNKVESNNYSEELINEELINEEFLNEELIEEETSSFEDNDDELNILDSFELNEDETNEFDFNISEVSSPLGGKPIGKHVRDNLNNVIRMNLIDRNEVFNLQRMDYSKRVFDIQYPFLRKVRMTDVGKVDRYWKKPVTINGDEYFVCSEWYENEANNDRPYFNRWLKKMKDR